MRIQFRSSPEFNPSLLSALAPFRGPDLDELALDVSYVHLRGRVPIERTKLFAPQCSVKNTFA